VSRELTQDDATPGGAIFFCGEAFFERVGEFSTELGPHGHDLGGGEDSVFVERALSSGERLMYILEVLQHHYVDPERLKLATCLRKPTSAHDPLYCHSTMYGPGAGIPMAQTGAVYF